MATARPPQIVDRALRRAGEVMAHYMPRPTQAPPPTTAMEPPRTIGSIVTEWARREFEKRLTTPYTTVGTRAGFIESNSLLSPYDLYGYTPWHIGALQKMRTVHHIIAPALDKRRAFLAGLDYEIVPRSANPDLQQILAASAVNWAMTHIENMSLGQWVADRDDAMVTDGAMIEELSLTQDGRPSLFRIPAYQVRIYDTDPMDLRVLKDVQIMMGNSGWEWLPAWKLAWYGHPAHEGQWRGVSKLRRCLSMFAMQEQDQQLLIDQARLSRGIVYLRETEHTTSEASKRTLMQWLIDFQNGIDSPLFLDRGSEIDVVTSPAPQAADFVERQKYLDQAFREMVGDTLGNLGVDIGSRALGETVVRVNAEQMATQVAETLDILSGARSRNSCTLRWLTALFGFDPDHCTPIIVAHDLTADDSDGRRAAYIQLVKEGGFTPTDFAPASRKLLIEDAGLEPSKELEALCSEEEAPAAPVIAPEPEEPVTLTHSAPPDVAMAAANALNGLSGLPADQRIQWRRVEMQARQLANQAPLSVGALRRIAAWRLANASYADAPENTIEWHQWQASGGASGGAWLMSVLGGMIP